MRKSSRLWWLHGAILLSAVVGCKNCNSGGSCGGPPPSGTPPYGATTIGGPTAGATGMTYGQGTYPTGTSMGGVSSMSGSAPFSSSSNTGFNPPATSSSISPYGSGVH
jgi:hypothetical protein